MAEIKRFNNKPTIDNGTTDNELSLQDVLISQHITGDDTDRKLALSQVQAIPYGVCNSAAEADKVVTLVNYPSTFTAQIGTKCLVKFANGNTKGSVNDGTYPSLTLGGVTRPLAAQGKTIAKGALVAGQIVEVTLTPDYWNIDSNIREQDTNATNGYTLYTDGRIEHIRKVISLKGNGGTSFLGYRTLEGYTVSKMRNINVYISGRTNNVSIRLDDNCSELWVVNNGASFLLSETYTLIFDFDYTP